MKYDLDAIANAAKEEVECVIPGAILMYLANAIKDKQIQLKKLYALAETADANTTNLIGAMEANETVGCFLLGLIRNQFGEKFLNMFIGDGPMPSAEGSNTLN